MIALLADLGQMLLMFFGSNLKRSFQILNFIQKIRLAITAICESLESFNRQASDDVFHNEFAINLESQFRTGRPPLGGWSKSSKDAAF